LRGQACHVVWLCRWAVLGALSGALAGASSFVFLAGLDRVTDLRLEYPWLLYLLPVAGLVVGAAYHYLGGTSGRGVGLLLDEIHEPTGWVPRRMAPFVLVGTWVTHLFGGSAGREGTALQMSGSLSDGLARLVGLGPHDRRMLLVASLAGGFGAVFGVPVAGAVFALEVQSVGRSDYEALVPAFVAAVVGDRVCVALGAHHAHRAPVVAGLEPSLLARIALAGMLFGLAGALFAGSTHRLKALLARRVAWAPLRPALGGVAIVGLAALFGADYLGLSLPLADRALAGVQLSLAYFALKLLFTVVTLGSGFPGGEVTPLFVMGATLGSALAGPLGLPVPLAAAAGFVAVFAGAANTPLACTVMGAELFGAGAIVPIAVACVTAYVFSGHQGIYRSQRVAVPKRTRQARPPGPGR
jgi:H+/Cl- antiporter ClcA